MADGSKPRENWSSAEIEAVVAAYFDLLNAELRGERPVKASIVRSLQQAMPVRSTGSIEFKMGNISAVLDELQEPWIDGYKPYHNYQTALRDAVVTHLRHRIGETIAEYQANTLAAASPTRRSIDELLVPPPSVERRGRRSAIGLTTGAFDAERLGLERRGRSDLAEQVIWVSDSQGDGAGYDIASFRVDGSPLHIEVKTTNLGVRTPFHITRWEVEVSKREAEIWALYRVFDFKSDPRVYRLEGSVEASARLEPSVFVGVPRVT
jgi:hypothetical protein